MSAGPSLARPVADRRRAARPGLRSRPAFPAHEARGPILVVEADGAIAHPLVEQLTRDGYEAQCACTAELARAVVRRCAPRLTLIGDLGTPHGAFELLAQIRDAARDPRSEIREMPVIVLGRSVAETDVLRAFEAGADDFLASPGRYLELRARMRALLRRVERSSASDCALTIGLLQVDLLKHAVSVRGSAVALRRLEFELLAHLASDPDRVFTKHELLGAVWGYRADGSTRTLDSHASRLRRKLERHGGRWVVNVRGVGYRLR